MMNKHWWNGFIIACLICVLAFFCALKIMSYTPMPIPVAEITEEVV